MAAPRVLSYGLGVDSTALLLELCSRKNPPELVLTADPGSEKPSSYRTLDLMTKWMSERGIRYEVVQYQVRHFKSAPPYATLAESLLINGCLPSISFGRHTCSLRFKVSPQERYLQTWQPAINAWANGQKVTKIIGLDAGPRDTARYAHAKAQPPSPLYDYDFPLQTWGWDRQACRDRIIAEGIPVPDKSSCTFCTGMKIDEVCNLPPEALRLIVLIEARAQTRLRTVEGLWRKSTRSRPGRMTDFILDRGLLPSSQIAEIAGSQTRALTNFLEEMARLPLDQRTPMRTWLSHFEAQYSN